MNYGNESANVGHILMEGIASRALVWPRFQPREGGIAMNLRSAGMALLLVASMMMTGCCCHRWCCRPRCCNASPCGTSYYSPAPSCACDGH